MKLTILFLLASFAAFGQVVTCAVYHASHEVCTYYDDIRFSRSQLIQLDVTLIGPVSSVTDCNCSQTITASQMIKTGFNLDGAKLGIKPGDRICFENGIRRGLWITNVHGTADKPVIFTNACGGKATFMAPPASGNTLEFIGCSYFKLTGSGESTIQYGIEVTGGVQGLNCHGLTTDFEVDHVYVRKTGNGPGIVVKTDPTCDKTTWRENFTLKNVLLHDNKIDSVGTEGFYIGNSHYDGGITLTCNGKATKILEHDLLNIVVYNNLISNTGNEAIQIGGTRGAKVYNNTIRNAGYLNPDQAQSNGYASNAGTQVTFYNNTIDGSGGFAVQDGGGGGVYYNNTFKNCRAGGFQLQDIAPNFDPKGFDVHNNTIFNCGSPAVFMYSANPSQTVFHDNVIKTTDPKYVFIKFNYRPSSNWSDYGNTKQIFDCSNLTLTTIP